MKFLILPDVHEKVSWKASIEKYFDTVDQVYFVGDYFDSHGDSDVVGEEAVNNFNEIVALKRQHPNKVHMGFGNHDAHYLFYLGACSNYQDQYARIFREAIINAADCFEMVCKLPNVSWNGKPVYVSHAGVSKIWYERMCNSVFGSLQLADKDLTEEAKINLVFSFFMQLQKRRLAEEITAEEEALTATAAALFDFPDDCFNRYGDSVVCPPTWIRPNALFNSALFENQIVGHTSIAENGPAFLRVAIEGANYISVAFIDNPAHDNVLILDSEVAPNWQDLVAEKNKYPENEEEK